MEVKSMWGNLTEIQTAKTPAAYLREQAKYLNEAMGYRLQGEVKVQENTQDLGHFYMTLDVVVPELNHYRYTLLEVEHPMQIYPLNIRNSVTGKQYECLDESDFLSALQDILGSQDIRDAIATLYSILPAEEPTPSN